MPLKLMYITNKPEVACIAESAGVDRIFVDMEYIGKELRQGGMNSVKNHHTVEDVRVLRKVLSDSELLVRVNPIHEASSLYNSTEDEVDQVIAAGGDIIMLPFFKTVEEVRRFVNAVNGRARTMLLLETPEAANAIDEIVNIAGIDEIHLGINDLSLGLRKAFMFELLADGTVERLCISIKHAGIPYGFGGIAAVGTGILPAEMILREHYRLGSSMVILSRSFCDTTGDVDLKAVREKFDVGVRILRSFESEIATHSEYFRVNEAEVKRIVAQITARTT